MTIMIGAASPKGPAAAPAEVVEFDLAAYNCTDNTSPPIDSDATLIVTPGGLIQCDRATGGVATLGTWLQGGGAPADASIYEVELVTISGVVSGTQDPADTDLQLNVTRRFLVSEVDEGVSTFTGTLRIKLVAGSVVQDTAGATIQASNLP